MKRFPLLLVRIILSLTIAWPAGLLAQAGGDIRGKVSGGEGFRPEEVIVQLLNAADKKLVKMEYADKQGNFRIPGVRAGKYQVAIQHLAYHRYLSAEIVHSTATDLGEIRLEAAARQLHEANVVARKPLVQQQYDKTVLNVAGSISAAGSHALEVLEKAPGITVDQNDNIAMRGRQGVLVMIDGKQVPMSGQDLATYLRSLNAAQIDRIDLITNPSAKYDAAGNAGIIDIRLKKGRNNGTNGTVGLSLGQGVYAKVNPSLSINHRKGPLNYFASYNLGHRRDYNDLNIHRKFFTKEGAETGGNDYDNFFGFRFNTHNARGGMDYQPNSRTTLGFAANAVINDGIVRSDSKAQSFDAAQSPAGRFNTLGNNNLHRRNYSFNLNFRRQLDTAGRELTSDLDYARYTSWEYQNYRTAYLDADNAPARQDFLLFGDLGGRLDIYSVKVDYVHPIKRWGMKLEGGIKSSWVRTDNDVRFFDRSDGGYKLDEGKSNRFIYKENINAAYLNGSGNRKKLSCQFGLRLEQTLANGRQVIHEETFDRDYVQLFPSGYLGYKFNDRHDVGVTLSRRIERPSYRELNPFRVFLDPLTSSTGNPALRPEITASYELVYAFREIYTAKAGYSRTKDNVLSVLAPDVEPNTVLQTNRNLARYDYYHLTVGVPVNSIKWLNSSNTVVAYYGLYRGKLVDTELNEGRVVFNFNTSNTITLDPKTTMEVNGNFQSRNWYGFLDIASNWQLGIGAQRQFWERKGSLKLNLSDVFLTGRVKAFTKLTGYSEAFRQFRDTRVLTMTFNYRFGGQQQGGPRRRTGGAEEEKRRAN
ncbi:outer membrane beta-barrel protein [Chitinophaga rhizosphaerae]|uniref:outer membrane beta-barrel protein n=1 Tax=Chitinophaga rhizosphaerae TaxID=1864947 RepID=UPI000F80E784|nr:outer membrane beta-barrel protein [Chitinophaga rhizosphaerae]